MHLTQYLIFEICCECNLGKHHPECPNTSPQRYARLNQEQPLTDDMICDIARRMYRDYGFRGYVGWHYYNEPLMAAGRMWDLMDRLDAEVPGVEYTLWTNGTMLPVDCEQFGRFADVHVTTYDAAPPQNVDALFRSQPNTKIHKWALDGRLDNWQDELLTAPCYRMFMEFVIDYYGNVHLCCFDWQGHGSIGNVHHDSLDTLVQRWQETRASIGGHAMSHDVPEVCLHCKQQAAHIPNFVPRVAGDARRAARKVR